MHDCSSTIKASPRHFILFSAHNSEFRSLSTKHPSLQSYIPSHPTMSNFQSVSSLLSPVDAARFTGRYEMEVEGKDGKPVKVLRSIRKADLDKLLLSGSITPTKAPPLKENAVDDLCNLMESKAVITKSPTVSPKVDKKSQAVDSVKLARARKSNVSSEIKSEEQKVKGILRKKAPKAPATSISPVRRSRRISGCARTRFGGVSD
jgi:hypothetical protein